MTTLYGILGVAPDADLATIRAAYRKGAALNHPDRGGDRETFERLKRAHDILVDPVRRAKYDATGDESEVTPDNRQAKILEVVGMALDHAVNGLIQNNQDPEKTDLQEAVANQLQAMRNQALEERMQMTEALKLVKRLAKRWRRGGDQENLMVSLFRGREAVLVDMIQKTQERADNFQAAQDWLKDYRFDFDRPEVHVYTPSFTTTGTC